MGNRKEKEKVSKSFQRSWAKALSKSYRQVIDFFVGVYFSVWDLSQNRHHVVDFTGAIWQHAKNLQGCTGIDGIRWNPKEGMKNVWEDWKCANLSVWEMKELRHVWRREGDRWIMRNHDHGANGMRDIWEGDKRWRGGWGKSGELVLGLLFCFSGVGVRCLVVAQGRRGGERMNWD